MMNTKNKITLLLMMLMALSIGSCDMTKTEEGEAPDLDVDVDADFDEGELPEYDVDWADIDIGTTTKTVEVPKVVVVMEEEEIEVPTLDIDMPDAGEKEERTLMIEAEVTGKEHDLEIQEIWATGKRLNVIAELEELETDIQDKKIRISDQVSINAPELDVRYFIIGERPDRVFNSRYTYASSMNELEDRIGEHDVIYKR